VLALTLPDFVNPDNARNIALVVGIGAIVLIVLVLRFVQKLALKMAFSVVLALVALLAWTERADLADCARTCDCNLLGFDVEVPSSADCPPDA
jgi:low temperature requirement protein LtrA